MHAFHFEAIDARAVPGEHEGSVRTSLQFICQKCNALSDVFTFEQTQEGDIYCPCVNCGTKNKVVRTGQTPSQPGLLPVIGVIQ